MVQSILRREGINLDMDGAPLNQMVPSPHLSAFFGGHEPKGSLSLREEDQLQVLGSTTGSHVPLEGDFFGGHLCGCMAQPSKMMVACGGTTG